ncbi:MAG: hypothetical protein KAV42_04270 [Candidatus Krumholzibacteria bacterium]|nr:hypothetical protein [Candidatus Krumholzibacteria bacterium]
MNKEQKTAWFILILFPIVCVGFFILSSFGGWRVDSAAFGIFGLIGLTPFIFRRRLDPSRVASDERDRQINRKAFVAGGMASYLGFVIGLMCIWAVNMIAGNNMITIDLIPLTVFCGWMIFVVVRSVVLLFLYSRGTGYAE